MFDELTKPNSGTINLVIRTLSDIDHVKEALSFSQNQKVDPTVLYPHTIASMIYACNRQYVSENNIKWLKLGDSIHSSTVKLGNFQHQPVFELIACYF
jgi:hypothetical protein